MSSASNHFTEAEADDAIEFDLLGFLSPTRKRWKTVLVVTVLCGVAGYFASFLLPVKYTATTVFIPPRGQQGGQGSGQSAAALASLGALSGLVGNGTVAARNTPDQYISMLGSARVSDRIIQKFDLRKQWQSRYQVDARERLLKMVNISVGKKDSLMNVDVTDTDPVRAAAIANQYVEELRLLTNTLAVTEAQQRRVFFEHLLEQTRDKLAEAQAALEGTGFTARALNVQPASAGEVYARLLAEKTAAEVRLQVLRNSRADSAPEVRQAQESVSALATQITKMEGQNGSQRKSSDYINRYRDFKYQETLFDLFEREYESARVDESHESPLIQVIDAATPPERKSGPGRMAIGAEIALLGLFSMVMFLGIRGRHARAE
jgi:uncharacterized protein involved in exopolysaccharide biosynthesis